ncbi:hypothetical protein E4M02_06385 [Brevundimonas sp. S30B]|uniref:Pr6Pr family membrane protein n=1 Tax=unclassified Brevundimonas TaxID=2622653 RepID=UPI0010721D85|nr:MULTISPECIES: Pr6Pr family membrane protein [unclassified Brevundimonas]QBX38023.1 hypothetical protein E4M01_09755 [Brevundimonas sp. MF30-B]TFW02623.1 hypothetical protein E4M02_06385 [Brevundimonas sp. S30B]
MTINRPGFARAWRTLFALIGAGALALQYGLMIGGQPAGAVGDATLRFFSFFTILTNVLVVVALAAPVLWERTGLGRWAGSEGVRAAVALYIGVVGLIYHLLLARVWDPQGWQLVADVALHTIMPLAFWADWLLFTPKGRLRWIDPLKWLAYPLAYTGWTLVHGLTSSWWPYWFLNVDQQGWWRTAGWAGLVLAVFLVIGLFLVMLDRVFGRGDTDRRAA